MSFLDDYASGLALRTMADQQKILERNYGQNREAINLLPDELLAKFCPYEAMAAQIILVQLDNASRGMAADAGEVLTCVQRGLEYGKPIDVDNLLVECGDVLWRIMQVCDAMGWTLEQVARANVAKLAKRYPEGYSDFLAAEENRNREAEDAAAKEAAATEKSLAQLHQPRNTISHDLKKLRELTVIALSRGWIITQPTPTYPIGYLTLRGDESEHWAAEHIAINLEDGRRCIVPANWLERRLKELEPITSGPIKDCVMQNGQGWAEPPQETVNAATPSCEAERLEVGKKIANESYPGNCSRCGRPIHKSNTSGLCTSCAVSPIPRH